MNHAADIPEPVVVTHARAHPLEEIGIRVLALEKQGIGVLHADDLLDRQAQRQPQRIIDLAARGIQRRHPAFKVRKRLGHRPAGRFAGGRKIRAVTPLGGVVAESPFADAARAVHFERHRYAHRDLGGGNPPLHSDLFELAHEAAHEILYVRTVEFGRRQLLLGESPGPESRKQSGK